MFSAPKGSQQRTALISVGAAILLIAVKLGTGLATGSLAFLAEAAHSATDLVAALLTLFAVRVAVRPADDDHQYGHGKAQHLAALGESAFLVLVSLVIAYLAARRLADGGGHEIEVAWWAIAVLALGDRPRRLAHADQPPRRAAPRLGGAGRQRAALRLRPGRLPGRPGRPGVRRGRATPRPTPSRRWPWRCWSSPPRCAWRASRSTC